MREWSAISYPNQVRVYCMCTAWGTARVGGGFCLFFMGRCKSGRPSPTWTCCPTPARGSNPNSGSASGRAGIARLWIEAFERSLYPPHSPPFHLPFYLTAGLHRLRVQTHPALCCPPPETLFSLTLLSPFHRTAARLHHLRVQTHQAEAGGAAGPDQKGRGSTQRRWRGRRRGAAGREPAGPGAAAASAKGETVARASGLLACPACLLTCTLAAYPVRCLSVARL